MPFNCLAPRALWIAGILLFVLLLGGCARDLEQQEEMQLSEEPVRGAECGDVLTKKPKPFQVQPDNDEPLDTSLLPAPVTATAAPKGRPTEECYNLQPAVSQKKKKKKKSGRCEPQSLPFARCRSGINSCCLGNENGPLTWFACEKQHGNTSLVPSAGTVLILGANKRNHMPTGHVAYVEKVEAVNPPNYRLIFSHTNYDRECSLETDIKAEYNSKTKTLDIFTGAWKEWGKGLPVAGFILR